MSELESNERQFKPTIRVIQEIGLVAVGEDELARKIILGEITDDEIEEALRARMELNGDE